MNDELERLMIDEARLHELMQAHMDWVRACLGDGKHTGWPPALAALVKAGPDDETGELWMHSIMMDFNEYEEKHRTMRALGRRVFEEKKIPVAVVLSSECWISTQRGGTKAPPHCEPRHDPMRREAIQISGLTLGFKHKAATNAPITRYKNDHMRLGAFIPLMKAERIAILEWFFLGFFEETAKQAGITLPECP